MNSRTEENSNLISEIELKIQEIEIEKLEKELLEKIKNISLYTEYTSLMESKMIFDVANMIQYYTDRIYAINEKIIEGKESLRNKVMMINQNNIFAYNVQITNLTINQRNYVVNRFYQKLCENNQRQIFYSPCPGMPSNLLNLASLEKQELSLCQDMNFYIQLIGARNSFYELINLLKNIIYNFSEKEDRKN